MIDKLTELDKITLLLILLIVSLPGVISLIFQIVRSRTKIDEQKNKAEIEQKKAQTDADFAERKRVNDGFLAMVSMLQSDQKLLNDSIERDIQRRKADEEFQESYINLATKRTDQINKIVSEMNEQSETSGTIRDVVTGTHSTLQKHVDDTGPSLKTIKEIPDTLQRIETGIGTLVERLNALPADTKNIISSEITPLKELVALLDSQVKYLGTQTHDLIVSLRTNAQPAPAAPALPDAIANPVPAAPATEAKPLAERPATGEGTAQ